MGISLGAQVGKALLMVVASATGDGGEEGKI